MARHNENKVVVDYVLKSEENLEAALNVAAVMDVVRLRVAVEFTRELTRQVRKELRKPLWEMENVYDVTGRHVGVWFWRPDWSCAEAWVGFKSWDMKRVGGPGLYNEEVHACLRRAEIASKLDRELRKGFTDKWWAWSDNVPDRFAEFSSDETLLELYRGKDALAYYRDTILAVARAADKTIPVRRTRRH